MVEERRQLDLDALAWGLTLDRGRRDADVQAVDDTPGWDLLWRLWPMQLIAWGLASMLKGWRDGRLAGGGLLLGGALLQLEMLRRGEGLRVVAPGPGRGRRHDGVERSRSAAAARA